MRDLNRDHNPDFTDAARTSSIGLAAVLIGEPLVLLASTVEAVSGHIVEGGVVLGLGTAAIAGLGVIVDRRINRQEQTAIQLENSRVAESRVHLAEVLDPYSD